MPCWLERDLKLDRNIVWFHYTGNKSRTFPTTIIVSSMQLQVVV